MMAHSPFIRHQRLRMSFLTVEMTIPCELLIKILGKVIPKVKNHYGCMTANCCGDPCISEFNAIVNQILKLKAVNKQWKIVLETFVLKKHLKQILFLHEQIMMYHPYPRFVLHKDGSEPFYLGLHPFRAEEVFLIFYIKG